MFNSAINVIEKINDLGYEAYIVGGFPRDLYLNIENSDIDICTNAPITVLKDIFFTIKDNSAFGSLVIKENNYIYEITIFRKDYYDKNRFPIIKPVDSLEEDLLRRDFIINTLCINKNKEFVDLMNAKKDLNNKIINCIGNADIKFKEDPLRILRAIRFSCYLNFKLSDEIIKAISNNILLLKTISKNKFNNEIQKILSTKSGKKLLKDFNIMYNMER